MAPRAIALHDCTNCASGSTISEVWRYILAALPRNGWKQDADGLAAAHRRGHMRFER
jgi:hypothetical protein